MQSLEAKQSQDTAAIQQAASAIAHDAALVQGMLLPCPRRLPDLKTVAMPIVMAYLGNTSFLREVAGSIHADYPVHIHCLGCLCP